MKAFSKHALRSALNQIAETKIIPRIVSQGNNTYILSIGNPSGADIMDFALEFTSKSAKIVIDANIWNNKIEWPKIIAGQHIEKHFCIGMTDPFEYEAVWSWVSFDKKKHREKATIAVEYNDAPCRPLRRSPNEDVQF